MTLQCNCLSSVMVLQFANDPSGEVSLEMDLFLFVLGVMEIGEAKTGGERSRVAAIVALLHDEQKEKYMKENDEVGKRQ